MRASQLAWQRYLWRAASVIQHSAQPGEGEGGRGVSDEPVGLSRPLSFQFACCEFWSSCKWKGEELGDQFIGTNKTALCWEKAAAALISGGFHILCDLFFCWGQGSFFHLLFCGKKGFDACSDSELKPQLPNKVFGNSAKPSL